MKKVLKVIGIIVLILAFAALLAVLTVTEYRPEEILPLEAVGNASFSRFSAADTERISLPCPFSWPVRLGNLKRCLLIERIPLADEDRELVLVNLHLEAYDDGEGKREQTRVLAQFLQDEYAKDNYVLAGGDFNQSFSNVDTSLYPVQEGALWECGILDVTQFDDGWQFLMDTTHPTCRSLDRPLDETDPTFQYYMIDGFILSPNLRADNIETLDLHFENSDHNPVRLEVTLQ